MLRALPGFEAMPGPCMVLGAASVRREKQTVFCSRLRSVCKEQIFLSLKGVTARAGAGLRRFNRFWVQFMDKINLHDMETRPLVLVIAGVDSGGGAGVTADIISVHDQGAWGMPVVTALTCQSLERVTMIDPVKPEIFKESIKLAVNDWKEKISAIKIGLVTDARILDILLDLLEGELKGIPVVWDPVLTATAGNLESADLKANLKRILKVVTVFTPNLPEALEFAGWSEKDLEAKGGPFALCDLLVQQGANAVLLKGGHNISEHDAQDVFLSSTHRFIMKNKRKEGLGAHGGGCALSSALAALIARGYALHDAAVLAKVYVTRGIFQPQVAIDHKRPPLAHLGSAYDIDIMPEIIEQNFPVKAGPFASCPFNMGIYPVVDSVAWLERLLALGVKTIQLRIKTDVHDDESNEHLVNEIRRACFLGRSFRARVFIDDHYRLAARFGAYGVHLGMEDLQTADLDFIRESGMRLGVSTHGIYEVCKVLTLNPSYIAIGHVFPTTTKDMESAPQGIARMGRQARMLKDRIPTVAIGGIKLDHAKDILDAGIDSIAVVTAITKAENYAFETQKWIDICRTGPSELYGAEPQSWHRRQDEQETRGPVPFAHLDLTPVPYFN